MAALTAESIYAGKAPQDEISPRNRESAPAAYRLGRRPVYALWGVNPIRTNARGLNPREAAGIKRRDVQATHTQLS